MRAGTDPLNDAALEYEAAERVAMPAVHRVRRLGQRWEQLPTARHRDELVAALEVEIPLIDRLVAANDRWLEVAAGRIPPERLAKARDTRNLIDHWISVSVVYLNKVVSTPTVTGGSPS